ncbi:MAG: hypothetical protein KF899_03175 [Parvibaculum sp.]|nr:hypothetical protein [Parvibaculum sp.]
MVDCVTCCAGNTMLCAGLTYVHDVGRERMIAVPLPPDDCDEFIANVRFKF